MIVKNINFSDLFFKIEFLFLSTFGEDKYNKIKSSLIKKFNELTRANLKIYQANMTALEFRRYLYPNPDVYSKLEFKSRKAGERRVKAKSKINKLINKIYPTKDRNMSKPENWMSDDIVYSVGEMIDRLIIEKIKTVDYLIRISESNTFTKIKNLREKIKLSQKWSKEVKRFLKLKLKEIDKKGYYEYIEETRTYNLKGIKTPKIISVYKIPGKANLILEKIKFTPLYKKIEKNFLKNFSSDKLIQIKRDLKRNIKLLAKVNFLCYQANMKIIEARRMGEKNPTIYSDLDLSVRIFGEDRVKAKSKINILISRVYNQKSKKLAKIKNWMTNDIVYSVGDMIDRLTIEFIKISDYQMRLYNLKKNNEKIEQLNSKIAQAKEWNRRVEKYLNWKLKEIDEKGYYDCVEETRTYSISNIKH
ncbi:MAG: hypothetical protein Q8N90_02290 [bacterium]|nr:hypothetical protein [bacterium]